MPWWGAPNAGDQKRHRMFFSQKAIGSMLQCPGWLPLKRGEGSPPTRPGTPPPGVGAPKIGLSKGISKKIQCTMPGPRAQDCPTPNPPPPLGVFRHKKKPGPGIGSIVRGVRKRSFEVQPTRGTVWIILVPLRKVYKAGACAH